MTTLSLCLLSPYKNHMAVHDVTCTCIMVCVLSTVARGKRQWKAYHAVLKGFMLYFTAVGEIFLSVDVYYIHCTWLVEYTQEIIFVSFFVYLYV